MGCGAVCGAQAPPSNKQSIYSQTLIQQLFPKIKISKPLLPDKVYRRFAQSLQDSSSPYLLRCGAIVATDEEVDRPIMEKWKILLYGLDKGDEIYKKCLGFQVRDEKQILTNEENIANNPSLMENKSYHQIKATTQYHQCFTQIEKDLNRTFEFKMEKKKIFENVLKRISNYFPSMGYTQGVNFIVGYLLLIGYSQSDAFWMFVHLAVNRRYMILGLYEDGFPLSYIYTLIFKNMLKRTDPQLYNHLYNDLMLDESMWIFKWFITYYIYSFPLNTIKYVWNLVIEIGGIGLVYYALALVTHLKEHLMKIDDPCDISEFWQSMKQLTRFNQLVNLGSVLEKVYELKLQKDDLEGINEFKPSFYKDFYLSVRKDIIKNEEKKVNESGVHKKEKINKHLHMWYVNLLRQRMQFQQKKERPQQFLQKMPQLIRNEYLDIEKSIQELEDKMIQNESIRQSRKQIAQEQTNDANYFHSLVHDQPFLVELQNHQLTDAELQENKKTKLATKISYDIEEEIDELQQQSDSNSEEILASDQLYNSKMNEQPSINLDSNEYLSTYRAEPEPDKNYNLKINTIVYPVDQKKRTYKDAAPKANNIRVLTDEKRSGLGLAGQNILCSLSITNSQYSDASCKNKSFKPRKQKENNISRYNKNSKVRTEQNSLPSADPSSERQSSIDHNTDKESFSGFTHRGNHKMDRPTMKDHIFDRMTQQDLMANSQQIEQIEDSHRPSKDLNSEIQIFNGDGLFKKKKRLYTRNSNMTTNNQGVGALRINGLNGLKDHKTNNINYQQQESIQSILQPLSNRKQSQTLQKHLDSMIYEIESIK